MLSYFLKNKKRAEIQNLMVAKTKNKNQWFYQNVQYAPLKSQDLSKSKEQKG